MSYDSGCHRKELVTYAKGVSKMAACRLLVSRGQPLSLGEKVWSIPLPVLLTQHAVHYPRHARLSFSTKIAHTFVVRFFFC